MAYVDQNSRKQKTASGIAAIAVVGVIGYTMMTGLAMNIVRIQDPIFVNHRYFDPPPPPPRRLPLQHSEKTAQQRVRPIDKAVADIPIIDISMDKGILPPLDPFTPGGSGGVGPTSEMSQQGPDRSSSALPKGSPGDWVTTDDYPSIALRTGQEGRTSFRLNVGADGRPLGCTVTQSSGSDDLDRATCSTLMHKAKFTPARDAQGDAIASSYASSVLWRIPSE